jgi:hypothetical protein
MHVYKEDTYPPSASTATVRPTPPSPTYSIPLLLSTFPHSFIIPSLPSHYLPSLLHSHSFNPSLIHSFIPFISFLSFPPPLPLPLLHSLPYFPSPFPLLLSFIPSVHSKPTHLSLHQLDHFPMHPPSSL